MALITEALNDAFYEDKYFFKWLIYAIPVFICINSFIYRNNVLAFMITLPTVILFLGLFSIGISNVTSNKCEILTLNVLSIFSAIAKIFFALFPHVIIYFFVGFLITHTVKIPHEFAYGQLIFDSIVCLFLFSMCFTSFLAFSKKLEIKYAYNLKIVFDSSVDVLIELLLLVPQVIIMDAIFIGIAWYLIFLLKFPYTHPLFIYYCSVIFVLNISVLSSYFAQSSYEIIKTDDDDYKDNYYIKTKIETNNNPNAKPKDSEKEEK